MCFFLNHCQERTDVVLCDINALGIQPKPKSLRYLIPWCKLTTLRALSYTTDPWIPYFSSIHENAGMLWSASFAPFRKVASIKYFFCDIVYGTPTAAESAAVAVGLKLWVCRSSWPKFHPFFPPLSSWGWLLTESNLSNANILEEAYSTGYSTKCRGQ